MKTKWMIPMTLALMLTGFAQAQTFEDDLYYNPKTAKAESKPQAKRATQVQESNDNVRVYDQTGTLKTYDLRNIDEYNRRPNALQVNEGVNGDTLTYSDSLVLDENGQPFEYSERIRRFHNPKFTKQITDDEYLSIYVEEGADVNIYYVDGNSNMFMSPYYYDNYWYPSYGYCRGNRFGSGWGMYYDPWMYSGWGYYDPWYSGYYGYGSGSWYDPWWGYNGYGYGGYYGGYYGYGSYGGYYGNGCGWYGGGSNGNLGRDAFSRNRHTLSNNQRDFISNVGSGRTNNNRSISGRTRTGSTIAGANSGIRPNSFGTSSTRGSSSSAGTRYSTTTRNSTNTGVRGSYSTTTRSSTINPTTRSGGTYNNSNGTTRQTNSGNSTNYGNSRSSTGNSSNYGSTRSSSTGSTSTTQTRTTPTSTGNSSSYNGNARTSSSGSSSTARTTTTSTSTRQSTYTPNNSSGSNSSSGSTYTPSSNSSSGSGSGSSSNSGSGSSSGGSRSSGSSMSGGRR